MSLLTRRLLCTLFALNVLLSYPHQLFAQAEQLTDRAQSRFRRELLNIWDTESLLKESPPTSDGEDFVSSATALRGFGFSLTSSAAPNSYTFPFKLRLNPTQLAGNPIGARGVSRFLRRTEVEVSYSPFTIKEEQRSVGTLTDTHLSGTPTRSVAFNYKIELIAPNLDDYDRQFNGLIAAEIDKARKADPESNLLTPQEVIQLGAAVDTVMAHALKKAESDIKRAFKLATSVNYNLKWDAATQDEITFKLTGSRSNLGPMTHPLGWTTEGVFLINREEGSLAQSYVAKASGNFDVGIMENVKTTTEATFAHYYGEGFRGIRNVLDKTKTDELNLGQAISLRLPSGHYVSFAVRALHIGTGDVDMTLATEFGFKFLNETALRR